MGNANAKAGKKGKAGESKAGESKTATAAESKVAADDAGAAAGSRGGAAAGGARESRRPSVVAQKSIEQKITKDDFIMLKTVGKGCAGLAPARRARLRSPRSCARAGRSAR